MVMTKLSTTPVGETRDAQVEIWGEGSHVRIDLPASDIQIAFDIGIADCRVKQPGAGSEAHERDRDDPLALNEAEWLEANCLALRQEAIERAESLDRTLAYVTERCAAIVRR